MNKVIKNKVKTIRLILIITLLFAFNKSYCQYGIQLNYIKPVGSHAYYFNPGFGAEIFVKTDEENRFGFGASFGLSFLSPRLDTFPTYTLQSSSLNNTLLSGYIIYKKHYTITFGINTDYKILPSKLTPVVGLDLNINLHSYDCIEKVETLLDSYSENEETVEIAIVPKIGLKYKMYDNCVLSAGIGKSIGSVINGPALTYWKTYVGVCFYY